MEDPSTTYHVYLYSAVTAAVLLALYLFQALRVRIRLETGPLRINSGTDGVATFRVRNLSPWTVNAHVSVARIPDGWYAATSFPRVRLTRGETATVFAVVRVPLEAQAGDLAGLSIRVRPNKLTPWLARRGVPVRVVDLTLPDPPAAAARVAEPLVAPAIEA